MGGVVRCVAALIASPRQVQGEKPGYRRRGLRGHGGPGAGCHPLSHAGRGQHHFLRRAKLRKIPGIAGTGHFLMLHLGARRAQASA